MITKISIYKNDFKENDLDGNPLETFETLCTNLGIDPEDVDELEIKIDTRNVNGI